MTSPAHEWTEADFKTLLKSLDLPQHVLCERLPHLSIAALRQVFEGLHRLHEGSDPSGLPPWMSEQLSRSKRKLICPICRTRFRTDPHPFPIVMAVLETLAPEHFDSPQEGQEKLRELCDEILNSPVPRKALGPLFAAFERLFQVDLGSPGPLVHTVEEIGGYEDELAASLARRPTPYTVWMVQRLLNGNLSPDDRRLWLERLAAATTHPQADAHTRAAAAEALDRST